MIYPDKSTFVSLAGKGNVVPVYREILADKDTPVSAFMRLREAPCFLLESVEGGEQWARYSFIGLNPAKIIIGRGGSVEIRDAEGISTHETDDPIGLIREVMSEYTPVESEGLPRFFGGLVGYIGYDMVGFMEDVPTDNPDQLGLPDMFLTIADTVLVFDNLRQTIKVVCNVHLDGKDIEAEYASALQRMEDVISKLRAPSGGNGVSRPGSASEFRSTFGTQAEFEDAVRKAKEYILAGDIFQLVLSQRFERESSVSPFDIYRALRVINPSPYMYFLDIGDAQIAGSSPEILVRLEDDRITLRPIAGTRPRGATEDEDRAYWEELKADPKEVAEHIMLVDLGRNDVGRVAEVGSVKVTEMMAQERYSHVMHMVSHVEGRLRQGLDSFDVLKACFPAGTVTGAPKIRAMEIINELEPSKRGPYAGSIGYFSYSGNMDTCITIRTIIIKDGKVSVQAGAGIVADSVPEREYIETQNKAMGMIKALEMAEKGLD
jgi:anthranilate synthase component 1